MQEYLIGFHHYIALLIADPVNITKVDALGNPSHYYCQFFANRFSTSDLRERFMPLEE
tara:strand:- start:110 stop:283 length:174 start_codon:yes stop_codon:yes gene_type:complete